MRTRAEAADARHRPRGRAAQRGRGPPRRSEGAEEWVSTSALEQELAARVNSACERNGRRKQPLVTREAADHLRYEGRRK